jgi:hypothetical protein
MANFTITRKREDSDNSGCDCFSTNQKTGQVAGDNALLDGNIVWFIDADQGYVVNVADFSILKTSPTNVTQTSSYKSLKGDGIPFPILGVVFEQVASNRIKVTSYLYPSAINGITGNAFVMPNNNVNATLDIVGCAVEAGEQCIIDVTHHIDAEKRDQAQCLNTTEIVPDYLSILTKQSTSEHTTRVSGILNTSDDNKLLFKHTVTAPAFKRFPSEPSMTISTGYYYTKQIIYTNSNMTSVIFSVYKGTSTSSVSLNSTTNFSLNNNATVAVANNNSYA